jgi:hypothetical protein
MDIGSSMRAYYVAIEDIGNHSPGEDSLLASVLLDGFTQQDLLCLGEEFVAATGAVWRGSKLAAQQTRCFVLDKLQDAYTAARFDPSSQEKAAPRRQFIRGFVASFKTDRSAMDTIENLRREG